MAHAKGTIGTTNFAVAITAGHHALTADEHIELGGKDTGPAPYELLGAALCACTAITLRMYALRKEWPLNSVDVDVHFVRNDRKEESMTRRLRLTGDLDETRRARLLEIAERTPLTLTLKHALTITTTLV
jgi:putative redox protein